MGLPDYLDIVRKRWASITLVGVLFVAASIGLTAITPPVYEARSQVYVSVTTGGTAADLVQGSSYTQRQVKSYSDLVTSPLVLQPVIERTGIDIDPEELAESVRAAEVLDTSLIDITVSRREPGEAAAIANTVASSLAIVVADLEQPTGSGVSPVMISTVRQAAPSTDPISPSPLRNLVLGLFLGLGAGVGTAILRELLDTKVRTTDHVAEITESAVIGTIGFDDTATNDHLIVQSNPMSHVAESFRRLRTNLQFLDVSQHPRALVVTSSLPGEGKSTTAANLALTLADAGGRTILVDADLRRPSVAEYMGLEGGVGLTTVLIGRAELEDLVQPWGSGYLHVLTAGQIPPNPSELLGSQAMSALLDQLASQYDHVVIDTPPLLPVTDATILAKLTGGAIVVASANNVHRHQLAEAVASLERVGARLLGVVLNKVERRPSETYVYDYSPQDTRPGTKSAASRSTPSNRFPATRRRRADMLSTPPDGFPVLHDQQGAERNLWPGEPLTDTGSLPANPRHSR